MYAVRFEEHLLALFVDVQDAHDYEGVADEDQNDRDEHEDDDVGDGDYEVGVLKVALDVTVLDFHAARSLREVGDLEHEWHLNKQVIGVI